MITRINKPISNTHIHPSNKNVKVTYSAEYTDKNEEIDINYSNLKKIENILDFDTLIKIMFKLRQQGKFNITIGYTIENKKQWLIEDFAYMTEQHKDTNLEIEQNKQINKQQETINNLTQKLEQYEQFIKKYNATKQFEEYKNNYIFWYELKYRGISPGCQPKDFIKTDNNKGKFGIVGYNRKLTEQELEFYEMKEYNN